MKNQSNIGTPGKQMTNINRSVDLSGKSIKGPVMSFGYPPITTVRPFEDYTPLPDLKVSGRDQLPLSLKNGARGYK